jgi:hypothetical protein
MIYTKSKAIIMENLPQKVHTPSHHPKRSLKNLKLSNPKMGLIIFILIFLLAGGVYLIYKSFAATTSAGNFNTCWVKTSDGSLWCWGDNTYGQLGIGSKGGYKVLPVRSNISGVTDVAVGSGFVCAIKNDGTLWCWGLNSSGQLGLGNNTDQLNPQKVALDRVAQISAGESHICASRTDDSLYCWGLNSSGQLGLGNNFNKNTPAKLAFSDVNKITTGSNHTCASKNDGALFCWGLNDSGQLGLGNTSNTNIPKQLYFASTAEISAGQKHTCATKTDGTIFCWGMNYYGQLGIGSNLNKNVPTQLYFASVNAISSGNNSTCASKTDGTLYCWGQNDSGQLGIGNNLNKNVPTQLYFASTAEISGGGDHTCATKTDGSLFCWGANLSGQLGIGDTISKNTPSQVTSSWGYPNGPSNTYANWYFSGTGYNSLEWVSTIAQDPAYSLTQENKLHYYAYQFWTTNNYSGYAGFQTNGVFNGSFRGKVINYSIWNSIDGRCVISGCLLNGSNTESNGYQLMIPYNYTANHRYQFQLKLGPSGYSGSKTWIGLYVKDLSAGGSQQLLGEVAIGGVVSNIFQGSTAAFGEDLHFWDAAYKNYACSDFQNSIAVYSKITANNGSVLPTSFTSSTNTGQTTDLPYNDSTVKVQNCIPNVTVYQDNAKQNVQMNLGYYGSLPPNVLSGY